VAGTRSRSRSNRFAAHSVVKKPMPVRLPPGAPLPAAMDQDFCLI